MDRGLDVGRDVTAVDGGVDDLCGVFVEEGVGISNLLTVTLLALRAVTPQPKIRSLIQTSWMSANTCFAK